MSKSTEKEQTPLSFRSAAYHLSDLGDNIRDCSIEEVYRSTSPSFQALIGEVKAVVLKGRVGIVIYLNTGGFLHLSVNQESNSILTEQLHNS